MSTSPSSTNPSSAPASGKLTLPEWGAIAGFLMFLVVWFGVSFA